MRTYCLVHAALAVACLAVQPGAAKADFRLAVGQPAPPPSAPLPSMPPGDGDAPSGSPAPPAPASPIQRARSALPRAHNVAVQGFGASVPLGFAVRQIVPTAVVVRFGEGVDPAASVTWVGGKPWRHVLAAAVQPLGLRVVAGAGSVLVQR